MDRPANLGELSKADWDRLQVLLDRFEQTWQRADTVDLDQFLPAAGDSLRPIALREFIKTDLEIRWRKGQTVSFEYYLKRFPELAQDQASFPPLLYEEFRVRHRHGDKPTMTSFATRFPEHFAELKRLIENQPPTISPAQGSTPTVGKSSAQNSKVLQIAGGYKLIERIGRGSFGEVWRAEAPGGVEVAIKIIAVPPDQEEANREVRALEVIKHLRHPYLLQLQGFWLEKDRLFIVMELADGSLRGRAEACKAAGLPGIPLEELLTYVHEAAEGLDYLHQRQVLHRDIKPDNILLIGNHAKLGDLGLARAIPSNVSIRGTFCGTPAYMAPEVWEERVGPRSDQYSLAATYTELRLSRPLFLGSLAQMMFDHLEKPPNLDPLDSREQKVLGKALAKKSDQRFGSCLEFWKALNQAIRAAEPARSPNQPAAAPSGSDPDLLGTLPPGTVPDPKSGRQPASSGGRGRLSSHTPTLDEPPATKPEGPFRWRLVLGISFLLVLAFGLLGAWYWFHTGPFRPVDFLPDHCRPDNGATIVHTGGKKLYDRLVYILQDETGADIPILFLLIPREDDDLPPFYIMRDKVSNQLFRVFAKTNPQALKSSEWEKGGTKEDMPAMGAQDDHLPVFRVTLKEAHEFALWLGGELPSAPQWDKAGGKGKGRPGPFEIDEADLKPGDIAVDRRKDGPMHIGGAPRDHSVYGCRDMAGNGREWTRTAYDGDKNVHHPVNFADPNNAMIRLRGNSYQDGGPYRFGEEDPLNVEASPRPDIGFRVVLNVSSLP